ncbi:MAG TPA: NUDIX domain-containing protein [Burkholderiales bacterium]|nr:NUDIX domain-containing protein [Burkholderiales bacterium]
MQTRPPRSAGAVVFRRTPQGVRLLVLRAYASWDFPKGLVEDDEAEFHAAQREVFEETGLGDLDYPFGEDSYKETLPYAQGKIARYYLAETETADVGLPVSPELGRPEHHEWRWVSFDEAEDVLPPRLAVVLDWARATIEGH